MVSPAVDTIALVNDADAQAAGAAFVLASPATVDAHVSVGSWTIVCTARRRHIVARGPQAYGFAETWRAAVQNTQRGLDVWCAQGVADLRLADPGGSHVVTWNDAGARTLRLTTTSDLPVSVSATATVRDAAGEVRPSPPVPSTWDASMRYYREAQLSDDLFSATRSLWLAVENLLDSLWPPQPGDRERTWLTNALREADRRIGLARYLPPGSPKAAHNHAYDYFYDDARTHLFHAKASRRPLLPHEQAGTNLLVARHERLTRLYLDLLQSKTGVRRITGVMTYAGFAERMRSYDVTPEIQVTDDLGEPTEEQTVVDPREGVVTTMPATRAPQLERPGLQVFCASMACPSHSVTKLGFRAAGVLCVIEGLFDLSLDGVTTFEAHMGFRLDNTSAPRHFPEM